MPRVFISHSSLDHELVEREIVAPLRAHGIETWYSTDSIKSASEWERQIRVGLKESDWFLIALSPRSVASEWVGREVHWAFLKRKERIIPVMLETCEPDDLHLGLLPLQFIDFRGDVGEAQERLLAVWGLNREAQVKDSYSSAREAFAGEDWAAAIEHLEAVLRLDPSHAQAGAELKSARRRQSLAAIYDEGLALLRERRWREALAALRQVQGVDGEYKDVADSIALAKAELQKEDAKRLYREALDAEGRAEWAEAVEQFEAALNLDPSHADAKAALGRAVQQRDLAELYAAGREHLQAKRWGEALVDFRKVRAIDKGYRGVADLIAEADAGREEEEDARRAEIEREKLAEKEAAARRKREAKEEAERQARELRERQEREQQERDERQKQEEQQPQEQETQQQKQPAEDEAEQPKREAEQPHQAETESVHKNFEFGAWRGAEPTPDTGYSRQEMFIGGAVLAGALLVILAFTLWPKSDPLTAADFYNRASAYHKQGNTVEAEPDYRKAIELSPNNAQYHYSLGLALFNNKKINEAEGEFRKAVSLGPNKTEYHTWLGYCLEDQGKLAEAETEYRTRVKLEPTDPYGYDALARILESQGKNKEEAEAARQKAKELKAKTQ